MTWLDIYRKDSDHNPGFGFWIWTGICDDFYFTTPVLKMKNNYKRKRRFILQMTIMVWEIELRIPLKHIGEQKPNRRKDV